MVDAFIHLTMLEGCVRVQDRRVRRKERAVSYCDERDHDTEPTIQGVIYLTIQAGVSHRKNVGTGRIKINSGDSKGRVSRE